jgi:hypothetical protein
VVVNFGVKWKRTREECEEVEESRMGCGEVEEMRRGEGGEVEDRRREEGGEEEGKVCNDREEFFWNFPDLNFFT